QVSVASLFQGVQMLLRSSLPDGVRLQMETIALDLTIEANYTELQQCLLNLGLNAIQAMPGGGTLILSADRHDDARVRMSVADTGVGMSDETRARLFSPFFTTKADGTGLGLISCKRIIESYGGSILVDSRLGEGTHFDMLVPMRSNAVAIADTEPPLPLGHGQRILLVDGEATRLSLLGNALSSQGYQPQLATDGAAALQLVQPHAMPDLVIIDSDIILLSAVSVLLSMQELGYQGPAIVLEDVGAPLQRMHFPADIPVHVLRKPLEMRRVFRAVSHALEMA
ncbi:hybrid sensor histidine kinase/response regulator, partial [Xanthomonas hortorum pv. gardneri]